MSMNDRSGPSERHAGKNAAKRQVKTDLRIRRTRAWLGAAFIALIEEKAIDEVTVREVLDRAKVDRSTFYVHYRDKDELFLSRTEHQQHHRSGARYGMTRAYRLYTGSDGNSHVDSGSVSGGALVEAESILFKETPAHSWFDWHNDPIPQYVITLSGVLEFTTVGSETFIIHPGDVLLAVDHTGSGHKRRLTIDEPWKRAYLVFKEGADTHFVPDHA